MSKIGRDQIEMKIKMSNILYKRILAFLTYTIGGENSFCQAYSEFFESSNIFRSFVAEKDGSSQVHDSHCDFIFCL